MSEKMIKHNNRKLIFPSIKPINAINEINVDIIKNDILPRKIADAIYFRVDYRFSRIVIDSLAAKYNVAVENYPTREEGEHFLIGSTVCENSAAGNPSCPYLQKAWEILKNNRISRKNIFAIYLLNLDDSEENEQRFLALTKEKVYLRWETKKLNSVDYENISFDEDGIISKKIIVGLQGDGYILKYCFDERFLNFAKEIQLLKIAHLEGIGATHPVRAFSKEKKLSYFTFLLEAACAGKMNVHRLLRLEYLAQEFLISADDIEKGIKKNAGGKLTDSILAKDFYAIETNIVTEEVRYCFYQELLDFTTDDTGGAERDKIRSLIEKSAGELFVKKYCAYLVSCRAADCFLEEALLQTKYKMNLKESYRLQRYDNALRLQNLEIGVMINGRESEI